MQEVNNCFKDLNTQQTQQVEMLMPLYAEWNAKINLISRKDFENFEIHHVLHSLAIARFVQFPDNATVIDIGTGGGFPGIPLAIFFPRVNFILVDSITKKIMVVKDVIDKLNLTKVSCLNQRAESITAKADYIISRATAPLAELVSWTHGIINPNTGSPSQAPNSLTESKQTIPNGWIILKGGDLDEQLTPFKNAAQVKSISDYFPHPYFETKKLIYLPGR